MDIEVDADRHQALHGERMALKRLSTWDRKAIEELKERRERLFSEPTTQRLLSEVRARLRSGTEVYIIRHIPEQSEDLYDVLVDGVTVVHVEIPRDAQNAATVSETRSVGEYLKSKPQLGKRERRKLELFLRLSR
jgi:hypothetical protein